MFYQNKLYFKIEKIYNKTLGIVHQSNAPYLDLLECNGSTYVHKRHFQFLLTNIYKSTVTTNPQFMWHFFIEMEVPYNLTKDAVLSFPPARSTTQGRNSAHFCGTKI